MNNQLRKGIRPEWANRVYTPKYRLPRPGDSGGAGDDPAADSSSSSSSSRAYQAKAAAPSSPQQQQQQQFKRLKRFPFYTVDDFQPIVTSYTPPQPFCYETNDFFKAPGTLRQLAEVSASRLWTSPVWIRESSIAASGFTLLPYQSGTALWVPHCGKEFVHVHALGPSVKTMLTTHRVPAKFLLPVHATQASAAYSTSLVLDDCIGSAAMAWTEPTSRIKTFFDAHTRALVERRLIPAAAVKAPDGRVLVAAAHPYTSMYLPRRTALEFMGYYAAQTVPKAFLVQTPSHVGVFYNGCQFAHMADLLQLTDSVLSGKHATGKGEAAAPPTAPILAEVAAAAAPTAEAPPAEPQTTSEATLSPTAAATAAAAPAAPAASTLTATLNFDDLEPPEGFDEIVSGAVVAQHGGMPVAPPPPATLFHDLGATATSDDSAPGPNAILLEDTAAAGVDAVADADLRAAHQQQPDADDEVPAEVLPAAVAFAVAHTTQSEAAARVSFSSSAASAAEVDDAAGQAAAFADEELSAELPDALLDEAFELDVGADRAWPAEAKLTAEADAMAEALVAQIPGALAAMPDDDACDAADHADDELSAMDVIASTTDASGTAMHFLNDLPRLVRSPSQQHPTLRMSPQHVAAMPQRTVAFAPQGAA